ncbi:hypothetical protein COCNU_scaffold001324G000050 [Cocos nucifera]|nr:hypothetical protein [Cocos nucifera]
MAKVGASSFTTPATIVTTSEIIEGIKVVPIPEVSTIDGGSVASSSPSPLVEDQAPQPPIIKDKGGEKKGKKVIIKMFCKACPGESSDDSKASGEDPFNDPDLVQDLTDRFALPEVLDQMADLDLA